MKLFDWMEMMLELSVHLCTCFLDAKLIKVERV